MNVFISVYSAYYLTYIHVCVHRSWFLSFCVRPACIPSPKKETSYCTSSLILSRDLTMSRGVSAFGHLRMCKLADVGFVSSVITFCCNVLPQADDSDRVCGVRSPCGSHSGGSRTPAAVLGTGSFSYTHSPHLNFVKGSFLFYFNMFLIMFTYIVNKPNT